MQTVGGLLGLRLPAQGMARCPFIDYEDSKPSFEVRGAGRRWICYSCGRRGGAIDLVMAVRGAPFIEAKRWLVEKTGIAADGRHPRTATRRILPTAALAARPAAEELAVETPPDHELYAALLARAPLEASGRDYLHGRCLADAIISRFSIGQMPGVGAVQELIRLFGFTRVQAAGLLIKMATPERPRPIFPQGALLFPYYEAESIAYLQARLISGPVEAKRWRNLNNRRRRIYNANILARADVRRVAICEGALDVLSAAQLGQEAVGLIGVSACLSDAQIVQLRGKQVDLLLDWDAAGEKRARAMLDEMRRFGIAPTRKNRPSVSAKDINEYLQEVSGQP
ncbi:MAG: toprim domain-containing protein [Parvibaculum sp.]